MYTRFKEYQVAKLSNGVEQLTFTQQVEDDMKRWVGRVALVTGASAGIGKEISVELLNRGVDVVACARRLDMLETIRESACKDQKSAGRFLAVQCDVSKEEDILAMFQRIKDEPGFGGVDICINNAGCGDFDKFEEGKTASWERMLLVNVLGLSICTREAIKSMRERGVDDGHVIHISSVVGHQVIYQVGTFYCATKFAVTALTEALRQELEAEKSKIRVSQISPGVVNTDFFAVTGSEQGKQLQETIPGLRVIDLAAQVIFVLSAPAHEQVHDIILTANSAPEV